MTFNSSNELGFYKLQRSQLVHGRLWNQERKLSEFEAWLWLCVNAMHSPGTAETRKGCVNLEVGELVAPQRKLAKIWGWSDSAVDRFIRRLKKHGEAQSRTASETGETVLIVNKDGPPRFFCALARNAPRNGERNNTETQSGAPIYIGEHESGRTGEPESMSATRSNDGAGSGMHQQTKDPERRTKNTAPQNGAAQWNRERFPSLAHLRHGLEQMKSNDQLHLNDRLDLFDLLREILGDEYVNRWVHCWEGRWRESADRVRQAVNGLIDDLLTRPAEHGIKNPAGHLNDIWQRLTAAQATDEVTHSANQQEQ